MRAGGTRALENFVFVARAGGGRGRAGFRKMVRNERSRFDIGDLIRGLLERTAISGDVSSRRAFSRFSVWIKAKVCDVVTGAVCVGLGSPLMMEMMMTTTVA